jgi:ABC-2 type transport system permease protein
VALTGSLSDSRPVRVRYFLRLKLRIIGNGVRGDPRRVVGFVVGLFFGLGLAAAGCLLLLASGEVQPDVGLVIAAFAGSAVVVGWLLMPLLFFGVDETLDPARFALLPLPRRTLTLGMLAAACIGIPSVATAVALLGVVIAGALRAGAAGLLVGLLGALLSLLLCVVISRAVTSALAALLRSRRVRDLTAIVLALFAASMGPLQLVLSSMLTNTTLGPALGVARVLGWTPLAAGFVAPYDIAAGQPLLAGARLLIVAAAVLLLLWWWSRTLESAMLGASTSGPTGARAVRGGAVRTLLPRLVRAGRPGTFTGVLARELRYWSRDPRRRSGLISITIGGAVVPVALRLAGTSAHHGVPLPVAVAFSSMAGAAILANQFGFDGTAYAVHLLAAVRGSTELRARAGALTIILVPVLVLITVTVGLLSRDAAALVPALGTVGAAFGASMASASFLSVYTAYPVPESRNAFASSSGSGSAKGLLSLLGVVGAAVIAAPIMAAAVILPSGASWLVAPVGIGWGVAAVLVATAIMGRALDRRGPELLVAVTPRR